MFGHVFTQLKLALLYTFYHSISFKNFIFGRLFFRCFESNMILIKCICTAMTYFDIKLMKERFILTGSEL